MEDTQPSPKVTAHQNVNELNAQIDAERDPAEPHTYWVDSGDLRTRITFQHGRPEEMGVNGITMEVLLAIVLHKLDGHQRVPGQKCRENALAMTKLEEAMHWLRHRSQRLHPPLPPKPAPETPPEPAA